MLFSCFMFSSISSMHFCKKSKTTWTIKMSMIARGAANKVSKVNTAARVQPFCHGILRIDVEASPGLQVHRECPSARYNKQASRVAQNKQLLKIHTLPRFWLGSTWNSYDTHRGITRIYFKKPRDVSLPLLQSLLKTVTVVSEYFTFILWHR